MRLRRQRRIIEFNSLFIVYTFHTTYYSETFILKQCICALYIMYRFYVYSYFHIQGVLAKRDADEARIMT